MKYLKLFFMLLVLLLICNMSCEKLPIAFFSMSKSSAEVDEIITFTNQSEHATSYIWDFGDGNTSTIVNPTHSFSSGGTYTVQLTANGDGGSNSISKIMTIAYQEPIADFSMDKSAADVDEIITFTNNSEYAANYAWSFGDGNTSNEINPTHSYTSGGSYTVQLTATGDGGSNSISKTIAIAYPEPVADFSMDKSTADVGETITFTNQSENTSTYEWEFGDGNTSTEANPTHSYAAGGSYTVQLIATGDGGSDSISKTITIAYPEPVADFSMDKSTAEVDEIITFTNQSENASTYVWSFGDGNTSTEANPTHSYSAGGSYTVQLTATGDGGTNSISKTITIKDPEPVADFSMNKSTAEVDEIINFTNQSENATTYVWDFGDGNTSTETDPEHSYSEGGTYTVQLTATGDGGTNSISKTITITYPEPVADFSMDKSTAEVDEIITFTNQSENAATYAWQLFLIWNCYLHHRLQ